MKRGYNNSGTVTKLKGDRRNPYWARLPIVEVFDVEKRKTIKVQKTLGYYRTESEARKALTDYMLSEQSYFDRKEKYGANAQEDKKKITFNDLWQRYENDKTRFLSKAQSTQYNYRAVWNKHLMPLRDKAVSEVKSSDIQAIIDNIQEKSGTKKNCLIVLRVLYDYALADDIVTKNYADYVTYETDEVEIARNVYTTDEIKKLWDNKDKWQAQLSLIMLYTGCRTRELFDLKIENVDLENKSIHIEKGKNKFAIRDIPIHKAILGLITELKGKSTDYLIKCENKPITRDMAYKSQEVISEITGTEHYVYDAKHTFITECVKIGIPEEYKITMIGHTPKTTAAKYYTHLSVEELREKIEQISFNLSLICH